MIDLLKQISDKQQEVVDILKAQQGKVIRDLNENIKEFNNTLYARGLEMPPIPPNASVVEIEEVMEKLDKAIKIAKRRKDQMEDYDKRS